MEKVLFPAIFALCVPFFSFAAADTDHAAVAAQHKVVAEHHEKAAVAHKKAAEHHMDCVKKAKDPNVVKDCQVNAHKHTSTAQMQSEEAKQQADKMK